MVIEGIEPIFTVLVAAFAVLAALAGIFVLGKFFQNKLKELFSDTAYFVFFFLAWGYFLYSIGEVAFYLTTVLFESEASLGIFDVYWSAGAIFILISFIGLTLMMLHRNYNSTKLMTMLIIGAALFCSVLYILFGMNLNHNASVFNYFYPLISVLIVTFALSVVLFSAELKSLTGSLFFFFLASCSILLGDILFFYTSTDPVYSGVKMFTDLVYLLGYGLSFVGFVALYFKLDK